MKVLHHTVRFLPASQTFVRDLINALPTSENLQQFVCCHERVSESPSDPEVANLTNATRLKLTNRFLNGINRVRRLAHNTNYRKATELLHRTSPDVIHCHFGTAAYFNFFIQKAAKVRIPVLVSFHGYDVFEANQLFPAYIKVLTELINDRGLCTCPSEFLKKELLKRFNIPEHRVIVIPNGFNDSLFVKQHKKRELTEQCNIVHVGRFIPLKGHRYLIEALQVLAQRGFNNITLTLIGDGETQTECKALAHRLSIEDKVIFKGLISHNEVADELNKADIYVHPSYTLDCGKAETFGVAILEAIATGLPVIISNSGGMPEVLTVPNEKYAKVVDQQSAKALAFAIEAFIAESNNFDEKEFNAFRTTVLNSCNHKTATNATLAGYKKLVNDIVKGSKGEKVI